MAFTARSRRLLALGLLFSLGFPAAHAIDLQQEQRSVEQWRVERVERLNGPTGWLTLAGLYWLHEGQNSFGRAKENALVLNHAALPATLGDFELRGNKVSFTARPGSNVTHDGKRVERIELRTDADDDTTTLAAGSIQFFAIERAGQFGVRVRDTEHPARKNFKGIDYYPISTDWALDARFEPYAPVKHIDIVNILGMTEQVVSPGAIVFTKDGKTYRLDAVLEAPDEKELFIMFADATSLRETYGAGRYIYIPLPIGLRASIDFNKAYNPPCAFTDFATCPLPPKQNRLPIRVDAGEKKYVMKN